jgi:very-short-patch-repair endonuclease
MAVVVELDPVWTLELQLDEPANEIPGYTKELEFHPKRKWRFDFAWPERMIAAEVEGGTWSGGRHTRGKGYAEDCKKYNQAQYLGWKVYRFTSDQVRRGEALIFLKKVFKESEGK